MWPDDTLHRNLEYPADLETPQNKSFSNPYTPSNGRARSGGARLAEEVAAMTRRRHSIIFFTILLTALAQQASFANSSPKADPDIVVIGGVQGAANTVATLLEHLELIDAEQQWSGGDTVLIQTGDLMDEGENVRATLDLFMRLQREAAAAGGRVIVLMGNHEAMNILGELRDVNYMAYQHFADSDSEDRQRQAWEQWVAWRQRRAEALGEEFKPTAETEAEWFAGHPPGWAEYADSMRPEGVYGSWLRSLPVAVEIEEVLFIHAGISPEFVDRDVASINRRAADEITRFDEYRTFMVRKGLSLPTASICEMADILKEEVTYLNDLGSSRRKIVQRRRTDVQEIGEIGDVSSWVVLDTQGPLWFRGAAKGAEEELGPHMASILDAFEVDRMVTGQSAGRERIIRTRFDNRVLLTSIEMSDDPYVRGGQPAALKIEDGDFFVVTLDSRALLIDN
jgi:hypothetical protein